MKCELTLSRINADGTLHDAKTLTVIDEKSAVAALQRATEVIAAEIGARPKPLAETVADVTP